jgi:hypothetical protein
MINGLRMMKLVLNCFSFALAIYINNQLGQFYYLKILLISQANSSNLLSKYRNIQMISKKYSQKRFFSAFTARQRISSHACAALYSRGLTSRPFALACPCSSSSNTPAYANALYACPFPTHFLRHHSYTCHYLTHQGGGRCNTLQ